MSANLLIILAASLLVIALFRRMSLPPVLGYLCVGLMLGPSALNWVNYDQNLPQLAEMGVVFLLFTLGLEFSLARMIALRRVVFGLGSLQVICCGIPLAGLMLWLGLGPIAAVMLGASLALSSTAIVGKELSSLGEVFSTHGQNAIGVLIFQDLVAVLLLTMLPALAGQGEQPWYWALPITLAKTGLLFAGLLVVSRWLLPRLFHEVAQAHSAELFVMLALVIVLLTAWLTHLLGLSMALGAFLAGMLLGESHYRHQIEADIRPFRDILLGLFFVSVGMLIDLRQFVDEGWLILGLTLLLLTIKGTVVALLAKLRGDDFEGAWRTGLALAQGGEFCFALVAQAQKSSLLAGSIGSLLLTATFCSMAITPLLLRSAPRLAAHLRRKNREHYRVDDVAASSASLEHHVVICGYGRVGQSIGRILRREEIPFVALDDDPVRVQEATAGESNVHFGDSRRADLLEAVGTARAKLLVVAVNDTDSALSIVEQARHLHESLPILVRTRDDSRLEELQQAGASEVVPEVLESSLMLASHALLLLGLSHGRVKTHLDEVRRNRYRLLHGYYHGAQANLLDAGEQPRRLLHAVNLNEDAFACGRTLEELALEDLELELQGVRRDGQEVPLAHSLSLMVGDAVLISGTLAAIEAGESRLLAGQD
ncbi:cation:proton antiporter [Metapseudomonas boanensis]|uniref:Monovalent cation:proton antiporter-2 (CPA2) family protein n=1 Tax=Metapseudomonas boanensis TaxID=2822138 RepID=A0ABS5XBT0_9GAMM|nr:monovalent cation:proton antiporter-2 (CPA2) family protein [Pseudomonas boanensis]MBT8765151.1 monovalent cation:proton antiporter-2 (CPA2) family protein [Pseudomonas boanensis]